MIQYSRFLTGIGALLPVSWKKSIRRHLKVPSMELRLENLARTGFLPKQVIDVGAFETEWSATCKSIFPGAAILLVEPQSSKLEHLRRFCDRFPDCQHTQSALGATPGTARFIEAESNSRIVIEGEFISNTTKINNCTVTPLDSIAAQHGFSKPQLLKIDAQGAEIEILKGAPEVIECVEVIILEVSLIRIGPVPDFRDVIAFMESKKFRLYDILELNYRPLDGALWQVDMIFVSGGSRLIASQCWD
jgi:FkbM family methyltransferase